MLTDLKPGLLYLIVFEPGFGESILLRIPPSDWVIIDGCTVGKSCSPFELLKAHNARWSCVVLTHLHADHTRGLKEILAHSGNGPVGCTMPLLADSMRDDSLDAECHLDSGLTEDVLAAIDDIW